jgi:hypothetical protein
VLLFGAQYFALIIPIVVALGGWITAVYWANNHPQVRHVNEPTAAMLAAGAADEGEEAGAGPGAVPQPRQQAAESTQQAPESTQQAAEPPSVPRQSQPERADRTGSARDR